MVHPPPPAAVAIVAGRADARLARSASQQSTSKAAKSAICSLVVLAIAIRRPALEYTQALWRSMWPPSRAPPGLTPRQRRHSRTGILNSGRFGPDGTNRTDEKRAR